MQILKEIGEVGVHIDGATHVLRPSLYAMTQIGDPDEIVRVFASVMQAGPDFVDALAVVYACADTDVSDIFGSLDTEGTKIEYRPGVAPAEHVVFIARCLLKHGVTGALPPLPQKDGEEPEYTATFDAREHVAVAMAHLGLSEREAWQMTMTSFVGAMRAKFPPEPTPGSRAPSDEQLDADMARLDRINAMRDMQVN